MVRDAVTKVGRRALQSGQELQRAADGWTGERHSLRKGTDNLEHYYIIIMAN